jgi:hypothetical protein
MAGPLIAQKIGTLIPPAVSWKDGDVASCREIGRFSGSDIRSQGAQSRERLIALELPGARLLVRIVFVGIVAGGLVDALLEFGQVLGRAFHVEPKPVRLVAIFG